MPPSRHPTLVLALLALVVLAGCSFGYRPPGGGPSATSEPTTAATPTPDPDRLGWEDGYAANDTLAVNASDGLNTSEREAVLARTMARVELLRGLEFEGSVTVEVISRAEYRNRSVDFGTGAAGTLTEQSWEAPLLVGEDRDAEAVLEAIFGSGVVGYYSRSEDAIVLVSDSPTPTVSRATLAHELVHALQDERGWLDYPRTPRDHRLGAQGLTEGDAVAVERRYERRCGTNWSCLPRPGGGPASAGAIARNPGVYLTLVQPYVSGPAFVESLRNRSAGWRAVNDAYTDLPAATEQTIHPERYPEDDPRNVTVTDRSTADWERVGNETLGEATVHVMFWKQRFVPRPDDAIRTDYEHPLSAGWAGDRLVAYRHADGEEGYVWRLAWDSSAEAREFHDAYTRLLILRFRADRVEDGVYVVDSGPFADAFRVTLDGDTVTIVNAPTVDALSAVGSEPGAEASAEAEVAAS